jgi:hypothetical protein
MEMCCPSPEHPVIEPTAQAKRHRKNMRYLMYGQAVVILAKMIVYGMLSGIF